MSIAASLDAALAAAIPRGAFAGVSIGYVAKGERLEGPVDPADKTRWRVAFTDAATEQHRVAAQAVIDGFDPTAVRPPRRVDFEDALDRLTDAEWSALQTAIAGNVRLARWYERAKTRGSINLRDPEVKTALAAVVQAGLFTRARLGEVFAAEVE